MIAMAFDLSSSCIGVTFAEIKKGELTYLKTLPVIPEEPDGVTMGYTTKKPKQIAYNGKTFKGFLKEGEFDISKAEADRRARDFKAARHRMLLQNVGEQVGRYLRKINPDVVMIEKNKAYNGILTTKLLAEIAGGMYFYAGAFQKDFFDYEEATVRAKIRKDIPDVDLSSGDVMALDTKWEIRCRLKKYFDKTHPGFLDFSRMTLDETDSLAIFYYWWMMEADAHET